MRLTQALGVVREESVRLVQTLKQCAPGVVDMEPVFLQTTFRVISRLILGQVDVPSDLLLTFRVVLQQQMWRFFFPIPYWKVCPTLFPGDRRYAASLAKLKAYVLSQIAIWMERVEAGTDAMHDTSGAILPLLVRTVVEQRRAGVLGISPEELTDHVLTLLFAGHDTTANTLCWTLYYVSKSPEVQARVNVELDTIDFEDLSLQHPLPWLTACIKEALRLQPSAPIRGRQLRTPLKLAGHYFPMDTLFSWSTWTYHRQASVWPEPTIFDPSRHTGEPSPRRCPLDPKLQVCTLM